MHQNNTLSTFFERAIHDLSSDLHVTQFCADELAEDSTNKTDVIVHKLCEASLASIEKIKIYRQFLTLWQRSEKDFLSFEDFSELLKILLSVVRDGTKKMFTFAEDITDFNTGVDAQKWLPVCFSAFRNLRESVPDNQINCKISFDTNKNLMINFAVNMNEDFFIQTKKIFESHFLFDIKKDHERVLLTVTSKKM